jgi:hypothetical protein
LSATHCAARGKTTECEPGTLSTSANPSTSPAQARSTAC